MGFANNTIIKTEDIWKVYDLGRVHLDILKGIDLEILEGDFVVILGPSGSGKSTLLNLISCLDVPSKGKVTVEGNDISGLSEDELAEVRGKKIGFVFQQFNLLSHLTALENVIIPSIFQGKRSYDVKDKAGNILTSLGLEGRVNHKPAELSGGEKQRVAIARSLINDPDIIVADEPTGNVDSKTGEKIMNILVKLNKDEGKTVIVVTHDTELTKFANRVISIKDGEIHDQ